jgi:hypothetical protein
MVPEEIISLLNRKLDETLNNAKTFTVISMII